MHLQARMRAHDWVSEVEQPVTTETVGRETQGQPGGEASPGENEKEEKKKDGEEQEERKSEGEEMKGGEEEKKEKDPRSVEVRSTQQRHVTQISFFLYVFNSTSRSSCCHRLI